MSSSISNAGLIEMHKKFMDFPYVALDGSESAYTVAQTAPQEELTQYGAARKLGTATQNATTGEVTLSTQFNFTGDVPVRSVCFLNALTGGVMLVRFVPDSGTLPITFKNGGSLIVEAICTLSRPA